MREPESQRELDADREFLQMAEIATDALRPSPILHRARASEGITWGEPARFMPGWLSSTRNEPGTYTSVVPVNSPERFRGALEFYKELYECSTPPGYTDSYMERALDRSIGSGGNGDELVRLLPCLAVDPGRGRRKIDFFDQPGRQERGRLDTGGQGDFGGVLFDKQDAALRSTIKWFAQPTVQRSRVELGGIIRRTTRF